MDSTLKIDERKVIPIVIILFISFLFTFASSNFSPVHHSITTDKSVFIAGSQGILHGKVLYRDLMDNKGPFIFFIYAIGTLMGTTIFSNIITGQFIIEVLAFFILNLFIYKTVKIYFSEIIALMATILFFAISFTFLTDAATELFSIICLQITLYYYSISTTHTDSKALHLKFCFLAGLFGSISSLIRINSIIPWIVLFAFIIYRSFNFKSILYFITGTIIPIATILVYALFTQSLNDIIQATIIWPMEYAKNTGGQLSYFATFVSIFMSFRTLFVCGIFILGFCISFGKIRSEYIFGWISVILTIAMLVVQRRLYTHYLLLLAPLIFYMILIGLHSIWEKKENLLLSDCFLSNDKIRGALYTFLFCGVIVSVVAYYTLFDKNNEEIRSLGNNVVASSVEDFMSKMPTVLKQDFFVIGHACKYYVYADYLPNCKYFYQAHPMNSKPEAFTEVANYIYEKKPKMLILDLARTQQKESDEYIAVYTDELKKFVEANYIKAFYDASNNIYILKDAVNLMSGK